MAVTISIPTWLVIIINGLVALVSAVFYISVFQFGYLHIAKRHRLVTWAMGILGISYQICVHVHITMGLPELTLHSINILFGSFLMASFQADMQFAKTMLPIAPVITLQRLKFVTNVVSCSSISSS